MALTESSLIVSRGKFLETIVVDGTDDTERVFIKSNLTAGAIAMSTAADASDVLDEEGEVVVAATFVDKLNAFKLPSGRSVMEVYGSSIVNSADFTEASYRSTALGTGATETFRLMTTYEVCDGLGGCGVGDVGVGE